MKCINVKLKEKTRAIQEYMSVKVDNEKTLISNLEEKVVYTESKTKIVKEEIEILKKKLSD